MYHNLTKKEESFNFWKALKFYIFKDADAHLHIFILIFAPLFFYFFKVKDKKIKDKISEF